jgi:hypothetical protein
VDAQGTVVTWGGVRLGLLRKSNVDYPAGGEVEIASLQGQVVGSGMNTRVVKVVDPVTITQPEFTFTCIGVPPLAGLDRGRIEMLTFNMPNSGAAAGANAFLRNFTIVGGVGELTETTFTFKMSGT